MTAITIADQDRTVPVCPVLALRLRSPSRRRIAEGFKALMQSWEDAG
jgi:hypothetical protein